MGTRTLPRNALVRPRARGKAVPKRARPWWPWARRALTVLFFAAVIALLVRFARSVDWNDVMRSLQATPRPALLAAIGFAVASHLLYSCFDLIGRHYTGHALATRKVMTVNFISYAFNLNLGSLVGGVAFRYRLYSRLGLANGEITRILSMSMLTNWLGYLLLGGFLFLVHPLQLPPSWKMGNHGLQWLGAGMMLVAAAYLVACLRSGDRVYTVRGHELYLPRWRMATLQLAMSCLNWSLMAGAVYMLLQQKVPYTDVLTVLLIGAVAGVIAHVPAGLGVFEFVFVALLSHQASAGQLIGALLGYRAIYYIAPLLLAVVLYLVMEAHARQLNSTGRNQP
ncbi:MAG TPA: lysylphosphatidylglycerol synthase domain-containing protein [Ramlibacter sp.]|nr:lysylphosphatidylglycerol synthase domain-containing protein [Ramlibacter sp.]